MLEPAADNHVIAVEPQSESFAVCGFLTDVIAHQSAKFVFGRGSLPSASEAGYEVLNGALRDNDFARFICFVSCDHAMGHKDEGPQNEEAE